jgi:hypothetical protein
MEAMLDARGQSLYGPLLRFELGKKHFFPTRGLQKEGDTTDRSMEWNRKSPKLSPPRGGMLPAIAVVEDDIFQ